jgi:hypothetical protein
MTTIMIYRVNKINNYPPITIFIARSTDRIEVVKATPCGVKSTKAAHAFPNSSILE